MSRSDPKSPGLLAYRELDEVLGLMETASEHLADFRLIIRSYHPIPLPLF
ncbi:MAG: hypothetical protein HY280_02615 [Nitrospinae bacterium]|nr:hypothetical protein [Nitrospinota bacterium]